MNKKTENKHSELDKIIYLPENSSFLKFEIKNAEILKIVISQLKKFKTTLEKALPFYDFNYIDKAISEIKITNKKEKLTERIINNLKGYTNLGYYISLDNEISLFFEKEKNNIKIESVINHELIHMASDRGLNQGFEMEVYSEKGNDIMHFGMTLDEGCTEYINEKYFNNKYNNYYNERSFIKEIEKIIGTNKLLTFYFDADLKSLMNELAKYNTNDELTDLLMDMDSIYYKIKDKNYDKTLLKIRATLADTYNNKILQDYYDHEIDAATYIKKKLLYVDVYKKTGVVFNENATITQDKKGLLIEDSENKLFIKDNLDYEPYENITTKNKVPRRNG